MKKIVIEKELCDPKNGEVVGPYYHIVQIDDEKNERTLLHTVDGNIEEAARYAERELDLEKIEIAYQENPDMFSSATVPLSVAKKRRFIHKLPTPVKKVMYWMAFPFVLTYILIGLFLYKVGDWISDLGDGMTGYKAHRLF